jgi:hypothetical protein
VSVVEAGSWPPVIYLVIAYAFAVLMLGGYLAWSLRRLREMEPKPPVP